MRFIRNSFDGLLFVFKHNEYRTLCLLNVSVALISAMLAPIFPVWLSKSMSLGTSDTFYLLSVLGVGSLIVNLTTGYISDFIGKRKIFITMSFLLTMFKFVVYALQPSVWIVIVVTLLTQISNPGLLYATLRDKIVENGHQEREGIITSLVRSSVSLSYIIGPGISIMIVSFLSYHVFYLTLAALSLGLFALCQWAIRDSEGLKPTRLGIRGGSVHRIVVVRWLVCIVMSLAVLCGSTTNASLLSLYIDNDFGKWDLVFVFGFGPLLDIVIFPVIGILNDRFGASKMVLLGITAEIIYFGIMGLSHSVLLVLLAQLFGSVFTGVLFTSLLIFIQRKSGDSVAFSSSMFFAFISLSSIIGNAVLAGVLNQANYNRGFIELGVFALGGLVAWGMLWITEYIEPD